MVLASTDTGKNLSDLTNLADKIMEVATPPIANITTTSSSSEVAQLRSEIGELRRLVEQLLSRNHPPHQRTVGRDNPVADAFSRVDIQAIHQLPPSIDLTAMATAQLSDPELQKLQTTSTSLKFTEVPIEGTSTTLLCDISTGNQRPYVPLKFCFPVFEKLHSLAHPGILLPSICSPPTMFGQVLIQMFVNGLASVCSASKTRFTDILLIH